MLLSYFLLRVLQCKLLIFRFGVHFELLLCMVSERVKDSKRVKAHFLILELSSFFAPFFEKITLSSLCCIGTTVKSQLTRLCKCIPGLYCFADLLIFMLIPQCLASCSVSGSVNSPTVFFNIVTTILSSLEFHVNLSQLLNFKKAKNLTGIELNL